ncbi:glycosyltransferase [Sabulicella rubraurantiaca]|uniref:glycosyltransferase n=1 Tax=Sabulicella rubraurantiaca TaxID=2811429 RepID=UPI001A96EEDF|nr:glycosyltransferase [Sabulicella rubraurantiaca]
MTNRVLHVLKLFRPDFTGEGVFLERCSAVMREIAPGVEHELLVTHTPRPAEEIEVGPGLSAVHYLCDGPTGHVQREAALGAWFMRHLPRFDVVHFRTHADRWFVSPLLTRLAGRRLLLSATLDDSLPALLRGYRAVSRPFARQGFRLFDGFVSISPKLQAETLGAGATPERCHLIPCGITTRDPDPEERERMRAELGLGEEDVALISVGGICARKDQATLVEAMPALGPKAHLILVGPELEPEYVAALRSRAAALGVADRVRLVGEQRDPHPWFGCADMFVFASRREGFGTAVPEAMAHGLPVVARRLPGVNEDFILPGETGFLFEEDAEYMPLAQRLVEDPTLRRRLGDTGRVLARTRFGMDSIAARYLEAYGLSHRIEEGEPMPSLPATASVTDPSFHAPLDVGSDGPPLLITTVDAEEAFDWTGPFRRDAMDVSSMGRQHLAHRVFEKHGVIPVYLTDYPVATQDEGAAPLRELLQGGHAELGAQLHPWVTPPFDEELSERNSYTGNLPLALQIEKAKRLTGALQDAFGIHPRIWRTGRFGPGSRTADIIKQLGYECDSSLTPCWPAEGLAEGSHWALDARPRWLDRERTLLGLPVSAALVGSAAHPELARRLYRSRSEILAGMAARFGLMERIRLSPEGITLDEAKRLVRAMRTRGHRVFVLTYHSPSLAPGNTPYARTEEDVTRLLRWLDAFYAFFREEIGGRPARWREIRQGAAMRPEPALAAE